MLLAASWNLTAVPAGVGAVNENDVHFAVAPEAGFASFSDETNVPDGAKPAAMYVLNTMSRAVPAEVGMIQLPPLFTDATRSPLAYAVGPVLKTAS